MEGKYLGSKGNRSHIITDSVIFQDLKHFKEIDKPNPNSYDYQENKITQHDELLYFPAVLLRFVVSPAVNKVELRLEIRIFLLFS